MAFNPQDVMTEFYELASDFLALSVKSAAFYTRNTSYIYEIKIKDIFIYTIPDNLNNNIYQFEKSIDDNTCNYGEGKRLIVELQNLRVIAQKDMNKFYKRKLSFDYRIPIDIYEKIFENVNDSKLILLAKVKYAGYYLNDIYIYHIERAKLKFKITDIIQKHILKQDDFIERFNNILFQVKNMKNKSQHNDLIYILYLFEQELQNQTNDLISEINRLLDELLDTIP